MSRSLLFVLLLATGFALAGDEPEAEPAAGAAEAQAGTEEDAKPEAERAPGAKKEKAEAEGGAKLVPGMSILGNQEAPKALVIVPWKSSGLGATLGISTMLDDSRQPVDKEVFLRALSYYEIRSERTP